MFCPYCGKELIEEAYICPDCGALVRELPKEQTQSAQSTPSQPSRKEKLEKVTRVFATISVIANAVAIAFFVLSIFAKAFGWIGETSVEADELWFSFWKYGWFLTVMTLEISLAAFILGCIQKYNAKVKKFAIGVFVGNLAVMQAAVIALITML